jgi:hypothetical protein
MRRLCLWAIGLLLMLSLGIPYGRAEELVTFAVTIPESQLSHKERVVALEINVTAGAFQAVQTLPVGWYFALDNDASWMTELKANATVGSASLSADDFRKLTFVIRKNEFGDLKFDLSGTISVTTDFEMEHKRPLTMRDFSLVEVKAITN